MHGLALFQSKASGARLMGNLALVGIGVARACDRDGLSRCPAKNAAVGGLAAGGGVEHGAVEYDAARLRHTDDGGAAFLQVGVLVEQAIGGHRTLAQRAGVTFFRTALAGPFAAPATPEPANPSRARTAD